jgi:cobalt/nickel transport system permease protein
LRHLVLDRWSRGSSPIHRLDARAKIAGLLLFLIALATAHHGLVVLGSGLLLLLAAGFFVAGVPLASALARGAVVLPFSFVFAAMSWIAGQPGSGLSLVLKTYLSTLAVLLVISVTPLPALLRGVESLGAPRFLLQVAQFLHRYLFVIVEEAQCMRQAAAARGASLRRSASVRGFRAPAAMISVLFARSYARAEAIHRAMLARGFNGHMPTVRISRFHTSDFAFLALFSVTVVALRLFSEVAAR